MILAIIKIIPNNAIPSPIDIHKGAVTHHQDQLIIPSNFNTKNTTNNTSGNVITMPLFIFNPFNIYYTIFSRKVKSRKIILFERLFFYQYFGFFLPAFPTLLQQKRRCLCLQYFLSDQ